MKLSLIVPCYNEAENVVNFQSAALCVYYVFLSGVTHAQLTAEGIGVIIEIRLQIGEIPAANHLFHDILLNSYSNPFLEIHNNNPIYRFSARNVVRSLLF